VKNSLSERAADRAGAEVLKSLLVGPTALAFVAGDPALAAKTLSDAGRAYRLLEFKGGILNGSLLSPVDVQSIARLPSREVLYAQLVGTVAAPLTGLVRTLNALIAGLAIQLGAIADRGLLGGAVPEDVEPPALAEAEDAAPAAPEDAEPPALAEAEDAAPAAPAAAELTESEPTEGTSDDGPSDV
jgi:large subunit ribosomal protein L10